MLTNKEKLVILGKNIKRIRLSKNLTMENVANSINVSLNSVKRLEKGQSVSTETFISIISLLGEYDQLGSLVSDLTSQDRFRASGTHSLHKEISSDRIQHIKKYGLTLEMYLLMWNLQDHKCGNLGCGEYLDLASNKTHVDHCHVTGKVRSLLCGNCNTALGFLKENSDRINGLAKYADKYRVIEPP